jgi:surface carbohydrate biosynthesis protein
MVYFPKVRKFFFFIFYSKFVFLPPQKKKYLFYDGAFNQFFIKRTFPKNSYSILYTRGEIFNLFIIIKNFLSFKFSLIKYFETYIKYIDPKFIITFIDNNILFFKLQLSNNIIKISIQSAWRTSVDDDIINFDKNHYKKKFQTNFFLTYNNSIGKIYSKFLDGKNISIGSFQSNTIKVFKEKKIFDILYISSWSNVNDNFKIYNKLTWLDFDKPQKDLVLNLYNYSLKYKKNFYILGKRNDPNEKKYYQKILGKKNWRYLSRSKSHGFDSYRYVDLSKIVITMNSSLGYESISRGNKTIFFSIREKSFNLNSLRFGWPKKVANKGIFWTDKLSYNECERLINRVLRYNTKDWNKIVRKYSNKFIELDEGNKILKKICSI